MKYLLLLLLPFTLALTALADSAAPDATAIQGTWLPVKAVLGGTLMKADFLTNTVLKLDGTNYLVTVAGSPDKGTFTLDAGAAPKIIDIASVEGANAGRKIPAIYELHENTLTICYGLGGSSRPREFKSAPGTRCFLVSYERKKP